MNLYMNPNISTILESVAEELDITPELHQEAVLNYEDVGDWLGAAGSPLEQYTPEIYPQVSFRLGTVVRPVKKNGEFDIDLVCRVTKEKEQTTQAELKAHVRGAINNGATPEEIQEVLLHTSIYCGLPRAVDAFRLAAEVVDAPKS